MDSPFYFYAAAFVIWLGVSIGCTTRVGTLLGEGEVGLAKLVSRW